MLRRARLLAIVLLLAPLAACVPVLSLQPFYTASDLTQDSRIVGTWGDEKGDDTSYEIVSDGQGAYKLTVHSAKSKVRVVFDMRLVRLDKLLFVDVMLEDYYEEKEGLGVGVFAMCGHMWGPIVIEPDRLTIRLLDDDWFKKAIEAGKVALPSYVSGSEDQFLLTASTADLRALARKILAEPKAFAVETVLVHPK